MSKGSILIYTSAAGQAAPLPGVTLTVTDAGGGVRARLVTDADGFAEASDLPAPGGGVGRVLHPKLQPAARPLPAPPPPLPLDKDGAGSRTAVRAGVSFVFRFCTGDCKTGKPMVQ